MKIFFEFSEKENIETRTINGAQVLNIGEVDVDITATAADLNNAAVLVRTIPSDTNINIYVKDENNSDIIASIDYWSTKGEIEEHGDGHISTYNVNTLIPNEGTVVSNILGYYYNDEIEKAYLDLLRSLISSERP